MMFRFFWIGCAALWLCRADAQDATLPSRLADLRRAATSGMFYSHSRQFVVHAPSRYGWMPQLGQATNLNLVRLEPALLPVVCERIKTALLLELGTKDQWRGQIHLRTHPAASLEETIVITSTLNGANWDYQVDLPDTLLRQRLVSAVVGVMLLEMANRQSSGHSADIPAWFSEGLSRHLMQISPFDLVLDPPAQSGLNVVYLSRSQRRQAPLAQARDQMRRFPPPTLQELSWPGEDRFAGETGESFRCGAQLFVADLLALKDGRACMRAFIDGLAQHLNWQLAFLPAFHSHFATLLDLEKWWDLQVVSLSGRELAQTWSREESRFKLDEILLSRVQVRTREKDLPMHSDATLQTIIQEWDFSRQTRVLEEKIRQLGLLRARISQDLVGVVDGYRQTLQTYLNTRTRAGFAHSLPAQMKPALIRMTRDALLELDALDARREELRQAVESPAPSPAAAARVVQNR